MTPEERFERIEQKIEFIVNQQAQFSLDLQQEREERREREGLLQNLLQNQINQLNAAVVGLAGIVGQVAEAQKITEAKMAEVIEGLHKLEEKAAETEGRLNAFITFVERYLSNRQNGQSEAT